jgi:hypothetical protein
VSNNSNRNVAMSKLGKLEGGGIGYVRGGIGGGCLKPRQCVSIYPFEDTSSQHTTSARTCVTSFSSSPFSRKNARCSTASCERTCGEARNVRARSRSAALSSPEVVDGGLTDSPPCEGAGEGGFPSSSGMGGFKNYGGGAPMSRLSHRLHIATIHAEFAIADVTTHDPQIQADPLP